MFSRSSPTSVESHQLQSHDNTSGLLHNSRKRGGSRYPPSVPQTTAWGGDEHILVEGETVKFPVTKQETGKSGIVVGKEISI